MKAWWRSGILLAFWIAAWVGMVANRGAVLGIGWAGCVLWGVEVARDKRRSVLGWTLANLLFAPFVAEVLALLPRPSAEKGGVYAIGSFLGTRLSIAGTTLRLGTFGLAMDRLRYAFVVLPEGGWSVLVHSSQTRSCVDLDLLSDAEYAALSAQLTQRAQKGGFFAGLAEVKFCLADYAGNFGEFTLADVRRSRLDVLGELGKHRQARSSARRAWFQGSPRVALPGAFFGKMEMDKAGMHKGALTVPWSEVGAVQVQTVNGIAAHFYVIPQGVSTGSYSFAKGKYGMNIPIRRKDVYTCEATFWRLAARTGFGQAEGAPAAATPA